MTPTEGNLFVLQTIRPDFVAAIIRAKQRAARSMCDAYFNAARPPKIAGEMF